MESAAIYHVGSELSAYPTAGVDGNAEEGNKNSLSVISKSGQFHD